MLKTFTKGEKKLLKSLKTKTFPLYYNEGYEYQIKAQREREEEEREEKRRRRREKKTTKRRTKRRIRRKQIFKTY